MSGSDALAKFYHSRKWEEFVQLIRLQRTSEDGEILCEYCGEPISRAYDCIGHHVVELDEINVEDATIALNPKNIQQENLILHSNAFYATLNLGVLG